MRNWHPGIQITCLHVAIGQWAWERGLVILRGFLPHNNLQKYPNALWAIFRPILVHYGAQTFWQEHIHIFLSVISFCIKAETRITMGVFLHIGKWMAERSDLSSHVAILLLSEWSDLLSRGPEVLGGQHFCLCIFVHKISFLLLLYRNVERQGGWRGQRGICWKDATGCVKRKWDGLPP